MTETDRLRTNDFKINKSNIINKTSKTSRGITLDNNRKSIDGLKQFITQTTKNTESSKLSFNRMIVKNENIHHVKSLSPEKNMNIDYILPPPPLNKIVIKFHFYT